MKQVQEQRERGRAPRSLARMSSNASESFEDWFQDPVDAKIHRDSSPLHKMA